MRLVLKVNVCPCYDILMKGGRGSNERLALVILLVQGTKVLEK
jgi:hypothetical protein